MGTPLLMSTALGRCEMARWIVRARRHCAVDGLKKVMGAVGLFLMSVSFRRRTGPQSTIICARHVAEGVSQGDFFFGGDRSVLVFAHLTPPENSGMNTGNTQKAQVPGIR